MAANLSKPCSTQHAIAYQDDQNPNSFIYLPKMVTLVKGDTIQGLRCGYWGFNKEPYFQKIGPEWLSVVGFALSGVVKIDVTEPQRQQLAAAIKSTYSVTPNLVPATLRQSRATPVIATLEGNPDASTTFPSEFSLGVARAYTVSSKENTLPALVANTSVRQSENAFVAVNINGMVEVTGDPWVVKVTCNLTQVWSYVRSKVSASVSLGWFRLANAEYQKIVQDLFRDNIIQTSFTEGSLDTAQYGRQIFESARTILEKINSAAIEGEGFFRFEPNPEPGGSFVAKDGVNLFGISLPWSVSVNCSYTSESFTQNIQFSDTITYTGRYEMPFYIGCPLALTCHKDNFFDIQSSEPCITPAKIRDVQSRIKRGVAYRNAQIQALRQQLINRQITIDEYNFLKSELRSDPWPEEAPFRGVSPRINLSREVELDLGEGFSRALNHAIGEGFPPRDREDFSLCDCEEEPVADDGFVV